MYLDGGRSEGHVRQNVAVVGQIVVCHQRAAARERIGDDALAGAGAAALRQRVAPLVSRIQAAALELCARIAH